MRIIKLFSQRPLTGSNTGTTETRAGDRGAREAQGIYREIMDDRKMLQTRGTNRQVKELKVASS